jgi:hypothetical protein
VAAISQSTDAALKSGHEYSIGIFDQNVREVLEVLVVSQKYLDLFENISRPFSRSI